MRLRERWRHAARKFKRAVKMNISIKYRMRNNPEADFMITLSKEMCGWKPTHTRRMYRGVRRRLVSSGHLGRVRG